MRSFVGLAVAAVLSAGVISMAGAAKPGAALVHRYSFNDGTAKDSVGEAHGKLVGGVKIQQGKAEFDGVPGTRIELLPNGYKGININSFKAATFEAWYSSQNSDEQRGYQRLFEMGATSRGLDRDGSVGYYYVHFTPTSPSGAAAAITDQEFKREVTAHAPTPANNAITCVVIVIDDEHISLYVNGKLTDRNDIVSQTLDRLRNHHALLGASLYRAGQQGQQPKGTLQGSIDEFRIYEGTLTPAQIEASFKAGPERLAVQ